MDRGLEGQMFFQVCHKHALGNSTVGVDRAETLDLSRRLVPDTTIFADRSMDKRAQNYDAVFLQASEIMK